MLLCIYVFVYICTSDESRIMRLFAISPSKANIYLDIFVQSVKVGNRIRCKPLAGQQVSSSLWVECSRKIRQHYPIGTIFKVDVRRVSPKKRKEYLATFSRTELPRAIEYYEHNLSLQSFI